MTDREIPQNNIKRKDEELERKEKILPLFELRKKRKERERREREAEERKKKEAEEQRKREEQVRLQREEQERQRLKKEEEQAQIYKKSLEEAQRIERERKAKQEEERLIQQRKDQEMAQWAETSRRIREEEKARASMKRNIVFLLILGLLMTGYGLYGPVGSDSLLPTIPALSLTTAVIPTPLITATASPTPKITPFTSQNTIISSIGMEFVLIPAGEFDMGSPWNEKDKNANEEPVHHVKIGKAFYMGKYEVTQKQWRDVMGTNPSYFKSDNLPVEQVSWNDVQNFIKKLNENESRSKYRLPSEAEWEYAARAGTATKFSFGDDVSMLGDYAWYDTNSGSRTHDVGQKKPNLWGLYDMHGNVWEWVQDNWHANYTGAPTDGGSWESGPYGVRVIRGGDWYSNAGQSRSAFRSGYNSTVYNNIVGFRLLKIS